MRHFVTVIMSALLAVFAASCGSSSSSTPTQPSPVVITEVFTGTLTVNGLAVQPFTVQRAGTASAQITALSDETAVMAMSLGTWNGSACAIVIANPAATLNTTVTGTAQTAGDFCVLFNDAGMLTAPVDFTVTVSHY